MIYIGIFLFASLAINFFYRAINLFIKRCFTDSDYRSLVETTCLTVKAFLFRNAFLSFLFYLVIGYFTFFIVL